MGILWTIIIGFIAGVIAKFLMPGDNEPAGFILTAVLGIVGAFVATFLGQALGWYRPGEGAGLIGGRHTRFVCLRSRCGTWTICLIKIASLKFTVWSEDFCSPQVPQIQATHK